MDLKSFNFKNLLDVRTAWEHLQYVLRNISLDNYRTSIRGWQSINYTEKRAIDAGAASLSDVANTLSTLIEDLKKNGVITK